MTPCPYFPPIWLCRLLVSRLVSSLGAHWAPHLAFASDIARNLIADLAALPPPPTTTTTAAADPTADAGPPLPDQFVLLSGALAAFMAPAAGAAGGGGAACLLPLVPQLLSSLTTGCAVGPINTAAAAGTAKGRALLAAGEQRGGGGNTALLLSRSKAACSCLAQLVPALVTGVMSGQLQSHQRVPTSQQPQLQPLGSRVTPPSSDGIDGRLAATTSSTAPASTGAAASSSEPPDLPEDAAFWAVERAWTELLLPLLRLPITASSASVAASPLPHPSALLQPTLSACISTLRSLCAVAPDRAADLLLGSGRHQGDSGSGGGCPLALLAVVRRNLAPGHAGEERSCATSSLPPMLLGSGEPRYQNGSRVIDDYVAVHHRPVPDSAKGGSSQGDDVGLPATLWALRCSPDPVVAQAVAGFLAECLLLPEQVWKGEGLLSCTDVYCLV